MNEAHGSAVQRYVTAWQEGDLDTVIDCYDPDIVAHYGGTSRFAGTHVGRDAFLGVLAESSAAGERSLMSVDQWHDDGDTGAVFATEEYTVDGERHRVQRALRYRIRDGRFVECWLFDLDQHVVDRAWAGGG